MCMLLKGIFASVFCVFTVKWNSIFTQTEHFGRPFLAVVEVQTKL